MKQNTWLDLVNYLRELEKKGEMEAVLNGAKQLESSSPANDLIRYYAATFFIDSGSVLRNLSAIDRGVSIIESLLDTGFAKDEQRVKSLKYNLSNGYASQYELLVRQGNESTALEALQKSKQLLQGILVERHKLEPSLLASVMTNYANTLDHLGRTFEAIDQYFDCLTIFPNHAMAMGNCGIAIKQALNISNRHTNKNLYQAWKLLTTVGDMQDEILEFANPAAIGWFQAHLEPLTEYIESQVEGGLDGLQKWNQHRKEVHGHPKAPDWLVGINRDRLLLTFNLKPLSSVEECVDDLFFQSLTTEINDGGEARLATLANSLNIVKEEYITARYLYYHTEESKGEYSVRSKITNYGNALDYADFGLSAGLLKASFRLAADCLDKVATFINEYFELGHDKDRVSFSNVWFANLNRKKGVHPILERAASSNQFVRALLDIKRDWYLQVFPSGRLKDARNKATHSKLVLYWMLAHNQSNNTDTWSTDEFRSATLFMLRITKAAILYSVASMDIEEQKKSDKSIYPTAPMIFETGKGISDRFYEHGAES